MNKHLGEIIIVIFVLFLIVIFSIPIVKEKQEEKKVKSFNKVIDLIEMATASYINDNIDNKDIVKSYCDGNSTSSFSVTLSTLIDNKYLEKGKLYNYCLKDDIDITLPNWSRVNVTYDCESKGFTYFYYQKINKCPEYF